MGNQPQWQDAPDRHEAIREIRLWQPAAGTVGSGGLSAEMTLAEFVRVYYEPVYLVTRDARPRSLEELRQSVKYWVRFTGDPPLAAISVYHARDFVVRLKELSGRDGALANNTVRKHCCAIQAVLDLCGWPDRWNRDGLGLLDFVPYLARPRKELRPAEDFYTLHELVRLLELASAARLPDCLRCSAAEYHRCLLIVLFNSGMRIGGAMGMTWRHYHESHVILPARTVAKGTNSQRIELNSAARAVIEAMRGCDAERIFPWPHAWPSSRHQLYDQFKLMRSCLPQDRRFGYHGVRKLHNNELARINGLACMKSLGHTTGRTTVEHYTSRIIVAEAVAKLPPLPTARQRQRRLFE